MKQLVILSGKGGTGKTTVSAALAHLASRQLALVAADADVDAANLELVLDPAKRETHAFVGGQGARIDPALCVACGVCRSVCRFDAVRAGEPYRIDDLACEGCGACFYQCPEDAIRMVEEPDGRWFRSDTRFGPLFHAHLFAGRENSGKLVTLVKQQARLRALDDEAALLLVDGPPGIGCPVIAAIAGADVALMVVEPTVSGVHDLQRVLATAQHFGVPAWVVINKADLNPTRCAEIEDFCAAQGIEVLGHIPFDEAVTEAMVQGYPVTEYADGAVSEALEKIWQRLKAGLLAGGVD
jgi:MinD superfamily P-loop ATPase